MVLFLSTVYRATDTVIRLRKRPKNANSSHKKAACDVFGDAFEKELPIPIGIDAYNHYMGAVDIGDQLRASYAWDHKWKRARWQPLGWGFLLGVTLVNSYRLDTMYGSSKDAGKGHFIWRQELAEQLFSTYSPAICSRQRARPGMFMDRRNTAVPLNFHRHVKRGKRASCKVCRSRHLAAKKRAKKPLGERDINVPTEGPTPTGAAKTEWGCSVCNVAICQGPLCWDMFHDCKIGVD